MHNDEEREVCSVRNMYGSVDNLRERKVARFATRHLRVPLYLVVFVKSSAVHSSRDYLAAIPLLTKFATPAVH